MDASRDRLVMIRGLGRTAAHWLTLPPGDIVLPDLPGAGKARGERCPWRVSTIAQRMMGRVQGEGPLTLVGLSLGGMVALHWASRDTRVAHTVVINSSLANLSPPWQRMRISALRQLSRASHTADPAARERIILDVTTRLLHGERLAAVLERHVAIERQDATPVRVARRQLIAAALCTGPRRLHGRLTVIVSDRDALCDPRCGEQIARRYGGDLIRHPAAGHDLPLDDPEGFIQTIRSRRT